MKILSSIFPSTTSSSPYKNHDTLFLSFSLPKKPYSRWVRMSASTTACGGGGGRHKKIVVIMGPTGCGKSKLSVDLATRFFPQSEIINSDKIQMYRGLDITTNKITIAERKNVPHHLLGEFDPSESQPEFTLTDFRSSASSIISQIFTRRKIPFIVGGSNSFIYALLAKKFNPELDVFADSQNSCFCKDLRYKCCFIWVDVSAPVLNRYLIKRVDDMLESGMYEELVKYFSDPDSDSDSDSDSVSQSGLKKAIGVPEFNKHFKKIIKYEEAVRQIKENTCQLAKRQLWKILRLRDEAGWELERVDATAAVVAAMGGGGGGKKVAEIWEKEVLEQSVKIVKRFLME